MRSYPCYLNPEIGFKFKIMEQQQQWLESVTYPLVTNNFMECGSQIMWVRRDLFFPVTLPLTTQLSSVHPFVYRCGGWSPIL